MKSQDLNNKITKIIRQIIKEELELQNDSQNKILSKKVIPNKKNQDIDEERLVNSNSKEKVKQRKNFIGSHIFGEDIGNIGKMYVSFSYGEHFPVYMWYKGKWYKNIKHYLDEEGNVNNATEQHKEDMDPEKETIGITTKQMISLIKQFKKKNGIKDLTHKSVDIGEKN